MCPFAEGSMLRELHEVGVLNGNVARIHADVGRVTMMFIMSILSMFIL